MTDVIAPALFPEGMDEECVNNGSVASAELFQLMSTAVRHLLAIERKLPTIQTNRLGGADISLSGGSSESFDFEVKPYLRDVYIKLLMDTNVGVFALVDVDVDLDIGGTVSSKTIKFGGVGGEQMEHAVWASVSFGNVGPNPGESNNGTATEGVLTLTAPSTSIDVLCVDISMLHTPVLKNPF